MIDHIHLISVGDMIEAINGQSLLGCRHYEVARLLKELPRGRTFTLKLTEPRKAFGEEPPRVPPQWRFSRGRRRWCRERPAGGARAWPAEREVGAAPPGPETRCWSLAQPERRAGARRKVSSPLASPHPQQTRLGRSVPAPPLFHLASLTLRNGPQAPEMGVGD